MNDMKELYQSIRRELENNLSILEDKPEETIDSTISALWHKASGLSVSVEKASIFQLPDLSDQQTVLLHQLLEQRLKNIPLAYLTGRQNFMGIDLICDNRALIPRKETEILGRTALEFCQKMAQKKPNVTVLDVCCGSGNLGLVLAHSLPNIIVNSSDLSLDSVDLTRDNISFLNLEDRVIATQSDLFTSYESDLYLGNIDLIVCNPPYISSSKVSKMNLEILDNEPKMAFDGGMIGLKIIQRLIQEAPRFLRKNGWLVFEVGLGQGPFVIQLCEKSNQYANIKSYSDISGNIRVIAAEKKVLKDEKSE